LIVFLYHFRQIITHKLDNPKAVPIRANTPKTPPKATIPNAKSDQKKGRNLEKGDQFQWKVLDKALFNHLDVPGADKKATEGDG